MKTFKVHACGNNAEEALHAAIIEDDSEKKNSGIQTKTGRLLPVTEFAEEDVDLCLKQNPPTDDFLRYIYLGGGEYLFFGAVLA